MRAIWCTPAAAASRTAHAHGQQTWFLKTRCVPRWYFTSSASPSERTWSTPLAKTLTEAITTTGPISVASYMRQCLTHPGTGYYTRQAGTNRDQFGTKGDFITSPEISQVFGELVGIWVYAEWLAQGKKANVQVMEVGPGRGTLMDDVLRNFPAFARSITSVCLVETSPYLRDQQARLLSGMEVPLKDGESSVTRCKYLPNCNIQWYEDVRLVPKDKTSTPFILAHEFFDALPIHVFQNVPRSSIPASSTVLARAGPINAKGSAETARNVWHELVVTLNSSSSDAKSTIPLGLGKGGEGHHEFELTVSKTPTPHSRYLPTTSDRYKALDNTSGAIIEVSPESLAYVSDFAVRIGGDNAIDNTIAKDNSDLPSPPSGHFHKAEPSGAALILDYGPSASIPANTLRGIRSHASVSPLSSPGVVDLSADVDFLALAEWAIRASPGVAIHGPVEQSMFLSTMGIKERAEALLKGAKEEEGRRRLEIGWKRLVDRGPNGMGKLYKAMAIVPYKKKGKVRRPIGFGGDVVG